MAQEKVQVKRRVKAAYERKRVKTEIKDKSLTQQSHLKRANINHIMKNYEKTGLLPVTTAKPVYGDTPVGDYHSALNLIREAEQTFMQVPAEIRAKFDNDAGKFLDFVNNPENEEELIKLGLAEAKAIVTREGVEVEQETPKAAPEATQETEKTTE